MGNWFSTKQYFYFLSDYEGLVEKLHDSSVKLTESIDSMNAVSEQLLIQMERDKENLRMNDVVNLERREYLSIYLVQTMKDSVVSYRNQTFQLLIELLKYVADIFNNKMNSLDKLKDEFELEIKMGNQFEEVECKKMRHLEERINNMKREIKILKDENDNHVRKTEHLEEELDSCRRKIREQNEKITKKDNTIQSETKAKTTLMAKMDDKLDAAKKQIERLQTENRTSTGQYKAHTEKLGVQINELKSELQKKKNELDTLTTEAQLKTKQIEQVNLEVQTLTKTKGDQNQMIEALKRDKQHLNQQVQATSKIKEEQSEMIEELKRDKQHLNQQIQATSKIKEEQSQMNEELKRDKRDAEEKIETMSIELRRLKQITSKRVLSMQVLFCNRSAVSDEIEEKLLNHLKLRLDTDQVKIRFERRATCSNVKIGAPLILICMTVSRIGTDVGNAVQGINLTGNMALVVVHHKDAHALPQQTSDAVLSSLAYKQLGGIFDIAYQREKGIYGCSMNSTSLIGIVNFIEKFGVRRPMYDEQY